ncbi:MAG: phosphoribosylanthranilate isomerase [Pedobacter sp.]|nr:MAG: phosphoribosylanthranilate isomerase [Pedobacter sp.]
MDVKLKICGMKEPANILEVTALLPDYLGFIFYQPSKRYIDGLLPSFVKDLPAGIKKTGVFVDEELVKVAELATLYGLNAVQLHGTESAAYCGELRAMLDDYGIEIIKAFGIHANFDFSILSAYQAKVDYFLFDTQTPQHGGSGKVFDWSLLDGYKLTKPYFLSGGIGPDSIDELHKINDPRLFAIDVNSKFEVAPGLKNIDKLNDFKNRI